MKIFLFYFEMAIKITGSAQNYRVGRVSGNTPIFRPTSDLIFSCLTTRDLQVPLHLYIHSPRLLFTLVLIVINLFYRDDSQTIKRLIKTDS